MSNKIEFIKVWKTKEYNRDIVIFSAGMLVPLMFGSVVFVFVLDTNVILINCFLCGLIGLAEIIYQLNKGEWIYVRK